MIALGMFVVCLVYSRGRAGVGTNERAIDTRSCCFCRLAGRRVYGWQERRLCWRRPSMVGTADLMTSWAKRGLGTTARLCSVPPSWKAAKEATPEKLVGTACSPSPHYIIQSPGERPHSLAPTDQATDTPTSSPSTNYDMFSRLAFVAYAYLVAFAALASAEEEKRQSECNGHAASEE